MPKVGMPEIRKPQLIHATMEAIDKVGLLGASVVMISGYAGVSPAIINHYFGGKRGLIEATMRYLLLQLSEGTRQRLAKCPADDVQARILAIVAGNFDAIQLESRVIKTWLAFWMLAMHDRQLFRLQQVNEKRLLSHLRLELKRVMPHEQARIIALNIAALIDGTWLRGALSPEPLDTAQVQQTINDYLKLQLSAVADTA